MLERVTRKKVPDDLSGRFASTLEQEKKGTMYRAPEGDALTA
jgi:hypothetical protein